MNELFMGETPQNVKWSMMLTKEMSGERDN
jgi:hypothetical protein